jgi:flagellin
MSTYINTNTASAMAALNLDASNTNLSNDIEKLSTGLRINTPADDPAGFVESENMASQLAGLNAATENSNNAVNMVNTADSALNQVQNLLISMRSLAVQASNTGTEDSTDIQADQAQIASAIASINSISTNTQYGTEFLLNGSSTSATTVTPGSASASTGAGFAVVSQGAWTSADAATFTSNTIAASTSTAVGLTATTLPGGTPALMTAANTTYGGAIVINGTTYQITTPSSVTPVTLAAFNTAIASSGYTASVVSGELTFTANNVGATTTPTINTTGLLLSGAVTSIASTATDSALTSTFATAGGGTGAAIPTYTNAQLKTGGADANALSFSGTLSLSETGGTALSHTFTLAPGTSAASLQSQLDAVFGTGNVQVSVNGGHGVVFTDSNAGVTALVSAGSSLSAYNSAAAPTATATTTSGALGAMTITNGGTSLTSSSTTQAGGTYYYSFTNGLVVSSATGGSASSSTLSGNLTSTAGTSTTGNSLEFQIGANAGQNANIAIGSTAAAQLGQGAASYTDANGVSQTVLTNSVADINVGTFKGAQDAIQVLNAAINQISTVRANLGAFQSNVLQSNVTSLGVATTNLQASSATITDADMATTVAAYTKDQILVSAGTSALAYANQMPQEILKLLQ